MQSVEIIEHYSSAGIFRKNVDEFNKSEMISLYLSKSSYFDILMHNDKLIVYNSLNNDDSYVRIDSSLVSQVKIG